MRKYHSTQFPSHLIDEIMPQLKDTEWRLLCILVRQTFGWKKEWDWLSTSQLKARTGRATAAVSHAIETLVRLQLIEVRTMSGHCANSPMDRRKAREGLLFRLQVPVSADTTISKSENHKANTTIDEHTKIESNVVVFEKRNGRIVH